MKHSIKSMMMGGAILFSLSMCLTSCEGALDDVLGEWSRPTPGNNTPSGGGSSTVKVTSITLNKTYTSLHIGNTETLTVETVAPADATDKTVTWSSEDTGIATVVDGVVTAVSIGAVTIKATANDGSGVEGKCTVYVGLLAGKFSVSATKQVQFSQGNLQYQASTSTWRFAENQYDYIGNAAGNTTATSRDTQSDWIDLFGWGTSGHSFASGYGTAYQPWSISTTDTDYGPTDGTSGLTGTYAQGDWGTNIGTGWRTLTSAEWVYLLDTRNVNGGTGNDKSYTEGQTVNGNKGLVIYPDDYTGSTYSSGDDWSTFEAAGCVFLPAAGVRNGTTVSGDNSTGFYWSSTPSTTTNAYYMTFTSAYLASSSNASVRNRGRSVRLVKNVE